MDGLLKGICVSFQGYYLQFAQWNAEVDESADMNHSLRWSVG